MDKNKMLIDATHPEETRVVVVRNGRVEEFDFESASRKLLRGNIYLAKVTRVEPSLQAAFVEYGGNRHGFLAFNEIHPDYYQIPVADREMLKQAEAEEEAREEAAADERARRRGSRRRPPSRAGSRSADDRGPDDRGPDDRSESDGDYEVRYDDSRDRPDAESRGDFGETRSHRAEPHAHDYADVRSEPAHDGEPLPVDVIDVDAIDDTAHDDGARGDADEIEDVASEEDVMEEVPERPRRRMRQYKIQEVIKRRQILLIQVVKEERGNKGAALTTYISLAGRYTVLMPNTGRGGGISRKITQPQDRKRLKAIAEDLDVAEGMGLIIRTAGAARTKQEIKRDYEYLLRLWESVRDLTLTSTAPCLVYEEGNLVKRSIRDLYSKDIDDIVVAGDAAWREARDFMGMLMPGHGDAVIRYDAPEPLFNRSGVDRQLNALFNPIVTLRSGGYIVINQTEALVAVDVNSGKSTREFSIEETALNTNLEAAEELARQLKLRDLAGLIVVDFIDMEEKRNNRKVEHRMKDALRHDRARIQIGRISHFGLLEMSRQRMRTGMLEGSTTPCPHCQGSGNVRSTESVALAVLRSLEEHLTKQPSSLAAATSASVALYILNHKRPFITQMERNYGIIITVEASDRMHGANFTVERTAAAPDRPKPAARAAVSMDWGFDASEAEDVAPSTPSARRESPREDDRERDRDRSRGRGDRLRDRDEPRRSRDDRDERPVAAYADDDRARDDEPRDRPSAFAEDDRDGGEDGGQRRRRRRRGGRDRGEGGGRHVNRAANGSHADDPVHADQPIGDHEVHPSAEREERGSRRHGAPRAEHTGHENRPQAAGQRDHDDPIVSAAGRSGSADELRDQAEPRDDGENGEDRKRRRRRGRRGGRTRGRDEAAASGEFGTPGDAIDTLAPHAGDWGVTEVQHAPEPEAVGSQRSMFDHVPGHQPALSPRPAIVEAATAGTYPTRSAVVDAPRVVETFVPEPIVPRYQEPPPPPTVASEQTNYTSAPTLTPSPDLRLIPEEPAKSTRKGWWQRKFGGGE